MNDAQASTEFTRILVVDDETDMELLIKQRFGRRIRAGEFNFLFAKNGIQALQILTDNVVDLVLSDINMPEMDGLTLLDNLKKLHADLRTIIISAYGDMRNIRIAMNRGAFDFLTKPIQFDDLENTIEKTVQEVRSLREIKQAKDAAERVTRAMSRYFSPNIAKNFAENPDFLSGPCKRREVSLIFTDLQGFTSLVEQTDPTSVVEILNQYIGGITQVVFDHDGTLIKVVGDAIQAMFGAPIEQNDHGERALQCALAIDSFAREFENSMKARGQEIGITRIGINSGNAIVGNFGGDNYFDYTAHGDTVNTASRLEGVNKYLKTRICVSSATVELLSKFKGRPVGDLILHGKTRPLRVYEPLIDGQDESALEAYLDAFAKLERKDPSANQAFAMLLSQNSDDPLAKFHLQRLLAGETGALIKFTSK